MLDLNNNILFSLHTYFSSFPSPVHLGKVIGEKDPSLLVLQSTEALGQRAVDEIAYRLTSKLYEL